MCIKLIICYNFNHKHEKGVLLCIYKILQSGISSEKTLIIGDGRTSVDCCMLEILEQVIKGKSLCNLLVTVHEGKLVT